MREVEDLTGKRFGKLLVLEQGIPEYSKRGLKITTWKCLCDCGRERTVRAAYLKRGTATYCGYCDPPEWLGAENRICRHCEFSEWDDERNDWGCTKGQDASIVGMRCPEYYCNAYDKISGANCHEGHCIVCGAPIYSYNREMPIYCYKHRDHAKKDTDIINEAPHELLFSLIAGIFLRAREDYIENADNQRTDAEVFLKGNWAQELSLQGFDAEKLMEQLQEEMTDGNERT